MVAGIATAGVTGAGCLDTIFLRDLEIETIIGIYDWERENKQTITIDLDMAADARAAASTDAIDSTLNYKPVAKRLLAYVGDSRFQLIETLAESVANVVLSEFKAQWVRVRINKLGAVRYASNVGVVIERGVRPGAGDEAVEVYVSAGSNISPHRNLLTALDELAKRFGGISRSTVYRNQAVGFEGDAFLNLVAGFSTRLAPSVVAAKLAEVENLAGRDRSGAKFGPRTLDLDMLMYGDRIVDEGGLTLPRPELMRRPFMLRPLAELAGHRRHPVSGRYLADLWRDYDGEPHIMTPADLDAAATD